MTESYYWHLITCEYPPEVGGVASHTRSFALELARQGESVCVWYDGEPSDALMTDVVDNRPMPAAFTVRGIRRLDSELNATPKPRLLLVQWVPHGYGYRSMNVLFCAWIAKRHHMNGDTVELVVHEPFLELAGSILQRVAALVHRAMMTVLLEAASRVWVASPEWGRRLASFPGAHHKPIRWTPVTSGILAQPQASDDLVSSPRDRPRIVGCFVGKAGIRDQRVQMIEPVIAELLQGGGDIVVCLIGENAAKVGVALSRALPTADGRFIHVNAASDAEVGEAIANCDVFYQAYPGGVTVRHTTALAILEFGRPLVTTRGRNTEDLWFDAGMALLVAEGDTTAAVGAIRELLGDPVARTQLGTTGRRFYKDHFNLAATVRQVRTTVRQSPATPGRLNASGGAERE